VTVRPSGARLTGRENSKMTSVNNNNNSSFSIAQKSFMVDSSKSFTVNKPGESFWDFGARKPTAEKTSTKTEPEKPPTPVLFTPVKPSLPPATKQTTVQQSKANNNDEDVPLDFDISDDSGSSFEL
jgi:hypothetical protein